MFLRNSWYVAAWSNEISREAVARVILNEPIVLFRKQDGTIVALEDRCVHRNAPLHLGRILGDEIRCGYHGLVFNAAGQCIRIPGQDRIPPKACIKSYKVVEKYGWVWIWMGRLELAARTSIPDFCRLSDPAFAATGATNQVNANYELINDNLLDLSHVGYVHQSTIGTIEMGEKGSINVERIEKGVRVTRWVLDCPPPPTHMKSGIFAVGDRVDRWQIIDYEPPCFINIYVGSAKSGTGAPQGNRVGGLGMWIMNAMTPQSTSSTTYFWGVGRDFQVDNPEMTKLLHKEISTAFEEDKVILEEQQKVIGRFVDPENVNIAADAGGIQARRLLQQQIKEEVEDGLRVA
jgi:phenylpropionate dioxygenase-like ring-hydroxylating dioxygenase large terminal subunit